MRIYVVTRRSAIQSDLSLAVAAACFAELGHDVICVDNDADKLAALRAGAVPIHEKFLPELLRKIAANA